jgi:hypothetical protein
VAIFRENDGKFEIKQEIKAERKKERSEEARFGCGCGNNLKISVR